MTKLVASRKTVHHVSEPRREKTCLQGGFPTWSDTDRAIKPQKIARLEFSDIESSGIVLHRERGS